MFLRAFLLLAFVLPYPFAKGQNVMPSNPFPGSILTAPGVNYYPHQWPQDQWKKDLQNIKKLGIEFVNIGDKAWASWQKGEGDFNLTGIEEVVNLAGEEGLKVVITLPVNEPPAWLRSNYENIANALVPQISNEIYANAVDKLIKGMARKFGQHEQVSGWIIPSHDPQQWQSIDRSQFAEKQFQDWLEANYVRIDSLNKSWGMAFVGEPYTSFGEIQLPREGRITHPLMDASYRAFRSQELQKFNQRIITELSAYVPETQWISLLIKEPASFQNPWEYEKLSFLSWERTDDFTGYPDAMDLGKYAAFYQSFFSTSGSVGFQEGISGNKRFTPETQRIALYRTLASGNQFMSPYRYRRPLYHLGNPPASLVERDGSTMTGYGEVYHQFIEELAILRDKYPKIPEMPKELRQRSTGIVYSPQQLWNNEYNREMEGWDYLSHLEGYHNVLKSMGCPVRFIQGNQDFTPYKVLIVAAYESIDEKMLERLKDFAKKGGNVIFTARSGSKNQQGTYLENGPSASIASLTGAKVMYIDQIPNEGQSKINHRGQSYDWNNWGESLELSGSIPLATHGAQHYTGRAAASFKTLSHGSVSYFGFDTDAKLLEQDLIRKVFERMRISFDRMDLGMIKEWRDGFWFGMNFGKKMERVPMDPYARIYVGTLDLGRGEICAWREKFRDDEKDSPLGVSDKADIPKPSKPTSEDSKKKKKAKKIVEPANTEKSLFEQTVEKRKKNN